MTAPNYHLLSELPWENPADAPPELAELAAKAKGTTARRAPVTSGALGFHSQISELPAAYEIPRHSHSAAELMVVLDGGCRVTDGPELAAGDVVEIPAEQRIRVRRRISRYPLHGHPPAGIEDIRRRRRALTATTVSTQITEQERPDAQRLQGLRRRRPRRLPAGPVAAVPRREVPATASAAAARRRASSTTTPSPSTAGGRSTRPSSTASSRRPSTGRPRT